MTHKPSPLLLLLLLLLLLPPVLCHPSLEPGDADALLSSSSSPAYWDRMDPHELLGEHQHAAGVSGDDELLGEDIKVSVVHVVQSCHLDIGFTSTVADVLNLYFHTHIPEAIAIGRRMRAGNATWVPEPGAYTAGNDRPGWPKNATLEAARAACASDSECVGFTYRNTAATTKRVYLKGHGATTNTDSNWTHVERPLPRPPAGWRLRFTMQSWYLQMYIHCPEPNSLGIRCPSAADKAALKAAVAAGDITWHAFPHNAELEAGSAAVIRAGLQATHTLDAELGVARKTVLSQRDVPGLTRAMIPLLKSAGIRAISVGVNGASMYPRVPRIFRWADPISGEEILAMWHARGYGGYGKEEAVVVPGFDHILVTDWNNDNDGVRSEGEYIDHLKTIAATWPEASVVVSTFDNFTEQLLKHTAAVEGLPKVTQEIGDSWIYGDPSDARKSAHMRALHRAWDSSEAAAASREPTTGEADPQLINATRFMLKNIEHTWGEHEHGLDYRPANWTNRGFAAARAAKPDAYSGYEATWWEQRHLGVNATREALGTHALGPVVARELDEYEKACGADYTQSGVDPSSLGWNAVAAKEVAFTRLTLADVTLGFDAASGAISTLNEGGVAWASGSRGLFGLEYITYSHDNFTAYQKGYSGLSKPPSWFEHDFGKPGDTLSNHTVSHGVLKSMWVRSNLTEALLLIALDGTDTAVDYGGADRYFLRIALEQRRASGAVYVAATFHVVEKTPTRHAEAMFLRFNPPQAQAAEEWMGSVELHKLGQWIAARSDLTVDGGSKILHGVEIGARVLSSSRTSAMTIVMKDAGVVSLGAPNGFPIALNASAPWQAPDVAQHGLSSMLVNNLWGTNYVMWQPYQRAGHAIVEETSYAFRYELTWGPPTL